MNKVKLEPTAALVISQNQTVQVVRTGTNTYFKDQKDGWIECIVGKI